ISAQSYLLRFYQSLGFVAEGEEYLEDDIPHWKMRWITYKY
ncbi:MAG: GNAT family N-acetyltransferase, partial [Bacteroidetes bacterium]|nr:GNAT family N-acetyltransferase [Bacteroidota bacterium]